jgi:small-conductance mechanosensitive channel
LFIGIPLLVLLGIGYALLSRSINKASQRFDIEEHTLNSFRLILRILNIVLALVIIFYIFELPTSWFVGGSALVGAAIGFGSSQTINNIVAGFYVILARPFKVNDFVWIGDLEGQVEEISINYTKIYTPSFNLLFLPNIQVMNNRVLNCTHEGFIKYTFTLSFPHSAEITLEEIIKECIEPSIDEFFKSHSELQLRKPEYYFESSIPFARSFKFRIFIPKGEAKDLYILQPELAKKIVNKWDKKRLKK